MEIDVIFGSALSVIDNNAGCTESARAGDGAQVWQAAPDLPRKSYLT